MSEGNTRSIMEKWALALGMSKERLAAIAKEVVEERQLTARRDRRAAAAAQPRPHR